jgi:LacI family transcriptional regulator
VLIETSTTWGRKLIRGIARYARQQNGWTMLLEPRGRGEQLRMPVGWNGDGIIARVNSHELAADIERLNVPAVSTSWYDFGGANIARCTIDEYGVARTGADYLADRGFRNFGYFPAFDRPGYVDRLGPTFTEAVAARGGKCETYPGLAFHNDSSNWEDHLVDLARWLVRLPKPVAVMTFGGFQGRVVAEACSVARLRVPDDVAILCSEEDELASAVSVSELSAVECGGEQVGYHAARLLAGMMDGDPPPTEPLLLRSPGVITRQSTEVLAIDDPELASAFRFIREYAHLPISVDTILKRVPLSRRALEQRFAQKLGRTPAAAIRHVRLERAQHYLRDTDYSVSEIAELCGFRTPEVFARVFKRAFGLRPSDFRTGQAAPSSLPTTSRSPRSATSDPLDRSKPSTFAEFV